MNVYKPNIVRELESFYGDLLFRIDQYPTIKDHLAALAQRMWEGVRSGNKSVFKEISNYHPAYLGRDTETLLKIGLTEKDCQRTVAKEYGFRRWDTLRQLNYAYNLKFELSINTLLEGNLIKLQKLVSQNAALVNQKSQYGHKATFLHYAVSNGVELWRQKVPYNLPEVVSYLLKQGADKTAKMKVYGGEYTATELLMSGAHAKDAGILDEMRKLLE